MDPSRSMLSNHLTLFSSQISSAFLLSFLFHYISHGHSLYLEMTLLVVTMSLWCSVFSPVIVLCINPFLSHYRSSFQAVISVMTYSNPGVARVPNTHFLLIFFFFSGKALAFPLSIFNYSYPSRHYYSRIKFTIIF